MSVPITLADGSFFGTLFAIDPRPARARAPGVVGMFTLFADLVAQRLDMHRRTFSVEKALANERKIAGFRDQFAGGLGHDLRNPLNAIMTSAELLKVLQPTEDTLECVSVVRSGKRMTELIENVLDFFRGSMGGGISIRRAPQPDPARILTGVIHGLEIASLGRQLSHAICLNQLVACDLARISQVLSDLLANALVHGAQSQPVSIAATSGDHIFELSVVNYGPAIAPEILDCLFEPFFRGKAKRGGQGLGLGLYIASEIAKARYETLTAASSDQETRFTFRMPIADG